jgi:hypothetical protein
LTWIGVVLRAARSVDGVAVRPEVVEEARTACRELRLIGKARRRDRRPTAAELARLKDYFMRSDNRRSTIPMCDIIEFAIQSARRQAEICRIEWADNDPRGRTGVVRDAKQPRAKDGNHRRFKYTRKRGPSSSASLEPVSTSSPSIPTASARYLREHVMCRRRDPLWRFHEQDASQVFGGSEFDARRLHGKRRGGTADQNELLRLAFEVPAEDLESCHHGKCTFNPPERLGSAHHCCFRD